LNKPKRGPERGAFAARQFGAEWVANPGSSRQEYLNDSAYYFGEDKEKFSDLSADEKAVCLREFNAGAAAERSLR
jgi:hypothetical protein